MKEETSAELYVRYKCSSCMKPELWPECEGCAETCKQYREASPADLAERNLGAVAVLEETKGWLRGQAKLWESDRAKGVLQIVEQHERKNLSPSALAEIREMRIKAEVLFQLCVWLEPRKRGDDLKTKDVLDKINKLLSQARRELDKDKRGELDDEG